MTKQILVSMVLFFFMASAISGFAHSGEGENDMKQGIFEKVFAETALKDGVREISYKQFKSIQDSGEKYILFDVLSSESYNEGHIEGAESYPLETINKETARARLSEDANIIVYCGSFQCHASTAAAKKLSELGYKVLDYKGGLKEWQEKGNQLVR